MKKQTAPHPKKKETNKEGKRKKIRIAYFLLKIKGFPKKNSQFSYTNSITFS